MQNFFPDQRWTSKGEPELGVIVVKTRVVSKYIPLLQTRQDALDNAPLRRVII